MEVVSFYGGYFLYACYFLAALFSWAKRKQPENDKFFYLLFAAVLFHGASLLLRWYRLGHGPYIGLYEGLSSGLWASAVLYLHLIAVRTEVRSTGIIGGFFLVLWGAWLICLDSADTSFPVLYDTNWFVVHVVTAKLSYGSLFPVFVVALFLKCSNHFPERFVSLNSVSMERLVYRYMSMVFTFATAMMVSGGIWAQKAWGREWSWDSLEIWSLAVWLFYGLYMHLRITYNTFFKRVWTIYVIICYILTFYNLFGVPFLSTTIHKGVI